MVFLVRFAALAACARVAISTGRQPIMAQSISICGCPGEGAKGSSAGTPV
jgi:hypothetical protein